MGNVPARAYASLNTTLWYDKKKEGWFDAKGIEYLYDYPSNNWRKIYPYTWHPKRHHIYSIRIRSRIRTLTILARAVREDKRSDDYVPPVYQDSCLHMLPNELLDILFSHLLNFSHIVKEYPHAICAGKNNQVRYIPGSAICGGKNNQVIMY